MTENEYNSLSRVVIAMIRFGEENRNENGFGITKLRSRLFLNDCFCYKVEYEGNILIVKLTRESEFRVLQELKDKGFPVPQPLYVFRENLLETILLFEEFLDGIELGLVGSSAPWLTTADHLAKMHANYWQTNGDDVGFSGTNINSFIQQKTAVLDQNFYGQNWPGLKEKITRRFQEAPITLLHGDAFSSNFLVHGGVVSLVDFGNACIGAYMVDIARLTSLPKDVDSFYCPNRDQVLDHYFQIIQNVLGVSKEQFMIDVKVASIIELASIYKVPFCEIAQRNVYQTPFEEFIGRRIEELANELIVI